MSTNEREQKLVDLLTRAIPALSVSVDLAKSGKSEARRRALLHEVEAAVGPQKVGEAVSYGELPLISTYALCTCESHGTTSCIVHTREYDPAPLRDRLNRAARAILRVYGYLTDETVDFATGQNARVRGAFKAACAAYEAFYGDSPDPAEIYSDGNEPNDGAGS